MSIQVAAIGNGFPQAELTQVSSKTMQPKSAEIAAIVFDQHKEVEQEDSGNGAKPFTEIMKDLERISVAFNKKLKFEVNHQSNDVTVKVIDPETDKVIKELPPKELQRLHSRLREAIGFLFDEQV